LFSLNVAGTLWISISPSRHRRIWGVCSSDDGTAFGRRHTSLGTGFPERVVVRQQRILVGLPRSNQWNPVVGERLPTRDLSQHDGLRTGWFLIWRRWLSITDGKRNWRLSDNSTNSGVLGVISGSAA
jgi:hypothetical protein